MTREVSEAKVLYGFLANPGVEATDLTFASDDVDWISWKYIAEEDVPCLRHTNEVIGAYYTAGARIDLYRCLDRLRENVTYCVTDSLIYIQPKWTEPH